MYFSKRSFLHTQKKRRRKKRVQKQVTQRHNQYHRKLEWINNNNTLYSSQREIEVIIQPHTLKNNQKFNSSIILLIQGHHMCTHMHTHMDTLIYTYTFHISIYIYSNANV